jgi:hypothetical protein
MSIKIDMSRDEILKLVEANTLIQEILHGQMEPLTDALRNGLMNMISNFFIRRENKAMSIRELCFFTNSPSACGCMGPQDGDPFCRCIMWAKLEQYKYDMALYIIDNMENENEKGKDKEYSG